MAINLLNHIYKSTISYGETIDKNSRKKIGQFFTPPTVAEYMGSLVRCSKKVIRVLDAGAGSGMLSGAVCQQVLQNNTIKSVHIDLYETDENILPCLKMNMEYLASELATADKQLTYTIFKENFILFNQEFWNEKVSKIENELYDVIISNPPYKKISKSAKESEAMISIVKGQPNIYFLFMAMAVKLLKKDGEMIYIVPRSFTSGAYFQKFREYFLENVKLTNLHLFHSRSDVFDSDKILQEAMILRAVKSKVKEKVIIVSASNDQRFHESSEEHVPYDTVVDNGSGNSYILIPTNQGEIEILKSMNTWKYNLLSLGFRLKTGPVVDFRATEFLKEQELEGTVPLYWANHFSNHQIVFPDTNAKKPQYIVSEQKSNKLLLENQNTLLIKRFTSKEEKRRVQCAIYHADDFNYKQIGIENHLNYIAKLKGNMTDDELYGLFALFNSSYIDLYYRILNGSTQVNATEINAIPLPSLEEIKWIGQQLLTEHNFSTAACDKVTKNLFVEHKQLTSNAI